MYHEYDLNLAKEDLAIYRPSETGIDSWDADDRIIFETAYRLHAKSFLKIQGIVLMSLIRSRDVDQQSGTSTSVDS